ncbi:MAG: winged helix-turn-helix transcriptional regulator [Deltaproteobacteria bacterium]|nr:winged helix-turn-helix transcriptional regulator [Deltaproteobacteria bacterium]MBW1814954.1 winged helix-turn-helix transcriptional regulator [Deltaproteobacteria bacterium]MBW1848216.1 winged helix-turn-helix transcriptional regulator [Deltaproteobacteria bacterium]MBW1983468.1 winged helix-turn-helix transcriptional regulator [Deltaproteobacteria bacterium]MBW2365520.1 winged helix-turn-helix transcriptional regulator [Deltaproteobacteria bacterium]
MINESTGMEIEKTDPLDEEAFSSICKALAHPARIRIISFLKKVNQCICGEIVEIMPLAQSTVSQHLKVLKNSGLVKGDIEGPRTCYCLDHNILEKFKKTANMI